jgi:hypothetical protein
MQQFPRIITMSILAVAISAAAFLFGCKGDTKSFFKNAKDIGLASYYVDLNLVEFENGIEKRYPINASENIAASLTDEERIFLNKTYDVVTSAMGKHLPWPVAPISPKFSNQYKSLDTHEDTHIFVPKGQGSFDISNVKTSQMLCDIADQDGLVSAKITFFRYRQDDFLQGPSSRIKVRLVFNVVDYDGKTQFSREIWGESKSTLREDSMPSDYRPTYLKHGFALHEYNRQLYREALYNLEEKLTKELGKLKLSFGKKNGQTRKPAEVAKKESDVSGPLFKAMQTCYLDLSRSGLTAKNYDVSVDEDRDDYVLFFNNTGQNGQDFVYYVNKDSLKIRDKIEQR